MYNNLFKSYRDGVLFCLDNRYIVDNNLSEVIVVPVEQAVTLYIC